MSDFTAGLVLALSDKRTWIRQSAVRTLEEIVPQLEDQRVISEILEAVAPLTERQEEGVSLSACEAIELLKAYRKGEIAAD